MHGLCPRYRKRSKVLEDCPGPSLGGELCTSIKLRHPADARFNSEALLAETRALHKCLRAV